MSSTSLADTLAVERVGDDEYLSRGTPVRMGNARPIAYGGSTLGIAVSAAIATVPGTHRAFSILGHYLGPASTDHPLRCKVVRTRSTATFSTRRVEVRQAQPKDGSLRLVMEVIVDFQVVEDALFTYNAKPHRGLIPLEESKPYAEVAEALRDGGKLSQELFEVGKAAFAANQRHFETRIPADSVSGQNFNGLAKTATSQDDLDITERGSSDWSRSRDDGELNHGDQLAILAFFMDGGLSFLPLAHQSMFLHEAGACSSLDFALRVYQPALDMRKWHFRERNTTVAGHGRTYSESRLWDQDGNMVASMTQQSILRPQQVKASI